MVVKMTVISLVLQAMRDGNTHGRALEDIVAGSQSYQFSL